MSRGWWRRNAVALIAVAVLLPATTAIVVGYEWWGYHQSRPEIPVTVDAGATADFAGATWGPATAEPLTPGPSDEVPAGAKLVVVQVPVDPDGDVPVCASPSLRELGGEGRQWNEATADVDWDYELPTLCDSEATGPFTVSVPFLLPQDATGPFGVEFAVGDELPRYLRLVVDP
jgi:hypothetical protein